MIRRLAAALFVLVLLALPAAAREPAIPREARNPPPTVPLATYGRFEIEPVALAPGLETHKGNVVARRYLQVDLDERVPKLVATRTVDDPDARTLRVQPQIAEIRFITGGKRLLFGGFAGNSWALVKLRLVDKATGELVAEPRFLQRANSILAGYSLGAADKLMLARIADMAAKYLADNFDAPVGGAVAVAAPAMD